MRNPVKIVSNIGHEAVERYGGYVVSFCIIVVLFSYLITQELPKVRDEIFRRINVMLRAPEPEPPPVPLLPAMLPAPAMTRVEEELERQEEPEREREREEREQREAASYRVRRISEALKRQIERDEREVALLALALEREKKKLRNQIDNLELRDQGRKFSANIDGSPGGALRRLVLSNYPQEIVNKVLDKYEIRVQIRYINADKGSTYLNSAETQRGNYYSQPGRGVYEVFQLSRKAIAKMVGLEIEEIKRRGLNPQKTRVIEVHFGIVSKEGDYDLGILDFEAEEIE